MDSAIVLENGASLNSILDGMENSTISEVVFPGSAGSFNLNRLFGSTPLQRIEKIFYLKFRSSP